MAVKSGKYRHSVDIEQLTEEFDEYGQKRCKYEPFKSRVPARVAAVSGGESVRAGVQIEAGVTTLLETRFIPGVRPEMRVLHEGRQLNIVRVYDPTGKRREMQIQCKEVPSGEVCR